MELSSQTNRKLILERVSQLVSKQDANATKVYEAGVTGDMIFPTREDSAEVLHPGKQPPYLP